MSDYVTLMGAEEVSRASYIMSSAADKMNAAASNMQYANEQHQRFLDDWLGRFEQVVRNLSNVRS